ncbi:sensor histidine kinase [Geoalkalibacter subterraneus]|uniref:sensor histidine kinase n=1 Tax=Geoalkalibacter subterraneus TaxID=483547 RepID=UPI000A780DDB|nr:ATP-binding protein [Geoalkalibacter subterraneus]
MPLKTTDVSVITKVIIFSVMLVVVGISSFGAFHLKREREHLYQVSRKNAQVLISTIERSIFNSMCLGNTEEVQTMLETVGNGPDLVNVRIFHPSGVVLKSSNPAELGQLVNAGDYALFTEGRHEGIFTLGDQEVIGIVSLIRNQPNCARCHGPGEQVLGILNLNVSLAETHGQLRETTRLFLFSTLSMIAILAAGISWVLVRFVKSPLRHLARQMARVQNGDLGVRITPRFDDEIGQLSHSFNEMVDNLEKAREELKHYHYRQMERADRLAAVGEMATGIAHEIKNPLAGISGAMSVLADQFDEDDERRTIIAEVLDQLGRLNKIATDLLHFGRPAKPHFSHIDVNELVRKTLFFSAQHPEGREVEKVQELADNLPLIWVDEKQIQQVLFNIIVNALQAMPEGGVLRISTSRAEDADRIRITISDTGRGVRPEQIEQIFTPFFTTKTQGTGLGLAICKQIIEHHGGVIMVESRLGEGTTFIIELPTAAAGGSETKGEAPGAETENTRR